MDDVIWILDGLFFILDGSFGIVDSKLSNFGDILLLGWVFSDLVGVIGILDCDYVILDNYFQFEGGNLLFFIVCLVFQGT